ncbi:AAA family ATPase [Streptococcus sp.]|uniref:AAA family ATPase n=1 Tax=Streptococcus sp. TaxID=1306 RepID=UPI00359FC312
MVYYKVGKDDSSFFKKRTTWELLDAIEAAQSGDTIELEKDFYFEINEYIVVSKDITIVGTTYEKDGLTFFPTICTGFIINNAAQVTLKNIYLRQKFEGSNVLVVRDNSVVKASNLQLENTAENGENYPIIYVDNHSNLSISDSEIRPSKILDGEHKCTIEDSKVEFLNSSIDAKIQLNNSRYLFESCIVKYSENNAINISDNSEGILRNCLIAGGNNEQDNPCLRIDSSKITVDSSTIQQANYYCSVYGENSTLFLENAKIDSLFLTNNSEISIGKYSEFVESVSLLDRTKLIADTFSIIGKDNDYINLYSAGLSTVEASTIFFGNLSQPNVKIERNVEFKVESLKQIKLNESAEEFELDDEGYFIEVTDLSDIELFGDKSAFELLDEMVGLDKVKSEVKEFIALAQMNKLREQKGLSNSALTLHSLFLGNPGTGKTTVARIIGKLLYEKKLITSDKYVETSRSDIVGQYIGETAQKTRAVLESALGGVLFIDEAYTLSTGGKNDFGIEAINEILKFMEDHRGEIVIIFAGYTDEMMEFLKMNEGLRSRIPNHFNFEDYTVEQLIGIGLSILKEQNYKVDKEKYAELVKHNYHLSNDNSNGRWIRNLNEKIIRKLALRLIDNNVEDINLITNEDLENSKI